MKNFGDESTKGGEALRGPVATETWVQKLPQQKRLFFTKGPLLDYHRVNMRYHRCTHLHGTLNITVHQLSRSLTCKNKNTHTYARTPYDKTYTRIIATVSKNEHDMNYSLDQKKKKKKIKSRCHFKTKTSLQKYYGKTWGGTKILAQTDYW